MTDKAEIVTCLANKLRQQLVTMTEAAKSAHDAATGDEAKAEGKYDTRGLEASYLAEAQAEQSQKLTEALRIFEAMTPAEFPPHTPVQAGALVETELNGELNYYFLTPCAGGMVIDYDGFELTTLSPDSPLYRSLLGKRCGELLDPPGMMVLGVS